MEKAVDDFSLLDILNREEKEELLNKKIEAIRMKNDALVKRHMEIEEDKRSAKDQQAGPDNHHDKGNMAGAGEKTPSSRGVQRSPAIAERGQGGKGQGRGRGIWKPPSREKLEAEMWEDKRKKNIELVENEMKGDMQRSGYLVDQNRREMGDSQRHNQNWGGAKFDGVKQKLTDLKQRGQYSRPPKSGPMSKMEMDLSMTGKERQDYGQWKAERDRIDQERLARHKQAATGEWRRQWDREKDPSVFEEGNQKPQSYNKAAGRIGSGRFEGWDNREARHSGPSRRGGGGRPDKSGGRQGDNRRGGHLRNSRSSEEAKPSEGSTEVTREVASPGTTKREVEGGWGQTQAEDWADTSTSGTPPPAKAEQLRDTPSPPGSQRSEGPPASPGSDPSPPKDSGKGRSPPAIAAAKGSDEDWSIDDYKRALGITGEIDTSKLISKKDAGLLPAAAAAKDPKKGHRRKKASKTDGDDSQSDQSKALPGDAQKPGGNEAGVQGGQPEQLDSSTLSEGGKPEGAVDDSQTGPSQSASVEVQKTDGNEAGVQGGQLEQGADGLESDKAGDSENAAQTVLGSSPGDAELAADIEGATSAQVPPINVESANDREGGASSPQDTSMKTPVDHVSVPDWAAEMDSTDQL